ncbi:MAG: hypothetical protein A2Y97_09655 [Nitrospirae bacterium RBG_13_39_12]|nr:MAG: hypothetical protein A2Y97_09655 [Nitrospirae bacterium RBG_13_39_12]
MIKNIKIVEHMEKDFISKQKLSYKKSMQIFEAMWNEGIGLNILPPKEPLKGIEVDIKIAKVLNSCLRKSSPG